MQLVETARKNVQNLAFCVIKYLLKNGSVPKYIHTAMAAILEEVTPALALIEI